MGYVHIFVFSFAIGGINYEPRNTPNTQKIFCSVYSVYSVVKKINPVNPVNPVKKLCAFEPLC